MKTQAFIELIPSAGMTRQSLRVRARQLFVTAGIAADTEATCASLQGELPAVMATTRRLCRAAAADARGRLRVVVTLRPVDV